ncbi:MULTISPECIES: DUF58 domain-containing protein [Oceanospirillaceae]|uniref:DUF58 domain-containing protein n=1 Tax=Oceanobacter antarcticus TaxID=3133425 RepID=A0ABW8NND6_9GAMM|tara:strand:+ start:15034 stop:16053 length:1020 start_codon:yes stop_codon:yes gene_type:complete
MSYPTDQTLNLFHHGSQFDPARLTRLSQLARRVPLRKQKRVLSTRAGNHLSSVRGRGLDYAENRQYLPGDDIRSMDWRVTARTGSPHIKVYQEEKERPVLLVTDLRASMNFGSRRTLKQLLAADLTALLGWATIAEGNRLGALIFNDDQELDLRPKPGNKQQLQVINGLATLYDKRPPGSREPALSAASSLTARQDRPANRPSSQQRMTDICLHLRRIAKPGTSIYFISDWHGMNADAEAQLFDLSRHCDLTAMQIYDPLEARLPANGWLTLSDGQRRDLINSSSQQQQHDHQHRFEQQQQRLQQHMMRLRMPLLTISTADDPLRALLSGLGLTTATGG